jgi:hypothetical protein
VFFLKSKYALSTNSGGSIFLLPFDVAFTYRGEGLYPDPLILFFTPDVILRYRAQD